MRLVASALGQNRWKLSAPRCRPLTCSRARKERSEQVTKGDRRETRGCPARDPSDRRGRTGWTGGTVSRQQEGRAACRARGQLRGRSLYWC